MTYQESNLFEVERILAKRQSEEFNCTEYLIRWKGYGPEEDSWEPPNCLIDCKEALAEFEASCEESQSSKKKTTKRKNKKPLARPRKSSCYQPSGQPTEKKSKGQEASDEDVNDKFITDIFVPQQNKLTPQEQGPSNLQIVDCSLEDDGRFFRIKNTDTGEITRVTSETAREDKTISLVVMDFLENRIIQVVPHFEVKLEIPTIKRPSKSSPKESKVANGGDASLDRSKVTQEN